MNSTKGFSLIESMVALMVMSILLLGIVNLSSYSNSVTSSMESRLEAVQVNETAFGTLQDSAACRQTLGEHCTNPLYLNRFDCESGGGTWRATVQLQPNQQTTEISAIRDERSAVVLATGANFGRQLRIDKIEFASLPPADGGVPNNGGFGAIEVRLHLGEKTSGRVLIRTVRLAAQTERALPAPISLCYASRGGSPISNEMTYIVTKFGSSAVREPCPGDDNCWQVSASCLPGDLPIGGDCLTNDGIARNVRGMFKSNLPISANCSGCPNNQNACDPACMTLEYEGYFCRYFSPPYTNIGARVLCLQRQ